MDASAIVVTFDVGEQVAPGLLSGCPFPLMDELALQRVKDSMGALSWRQPFRLIDGVALIAARCFP